MPAVGTHLQYIKKAEAKSSNSKSNSNSSRSRSQAQLWSVTRQDQQQVYLAHETYADLLCQMETENIGAHKL